MKGKVRERVMKKTDDLSGQVFGLWHVLDESRISGGRMQWLCVCECGTKRFVDANNLVAGRSRSCGCLSAGRTKSSAADLTGQQFGLLKVISRAESRNGRTRWLCRCECGSETTVASHDLTSGKTRSCGCMRRRKAESMELIKDLSDMQIGRLHVDAATSLRDAKGSAYWRCTCSCGNTALVTSDRLLHGNCRSCGCLKNEITSQIHSRLHFIDGTCVEFLQGRKIRSDNTSGFRGVFRTKNGKFRVSIGFQRRRYYVGTFESFEEAVDARLAAEKKYYNSFLENYFAGGLSVECAPKQLAAQV